MDVPIVIPILDNDIDTVSVVDIPTAAANGTCSIVQRGTAVTYTPNEGFVGVDHCDYTACNEAVSPCCDTATITITVDEPNPTKKPTSCPPADTNPNTTPEVPTKVK